MINHKLYEGTIVHERFFPRHHKLSYGFFQVYVDLDDIDSLASQSRWWSVEKFNLVSFRRKDYLAGDPDLKKAVIDRIHSETGKSFSGKVFLLASLRYWGYCYNPVSFYFCYDSSDQLCFILDEINNTPWNQRHCYVHDCSLSEQSKRQTIPQSNQKLNQQFNQKFPKKSSSIGHFSQIKDTTLGNVGKYRKNNDHSFNFDKAFHVSPFMPMNLYYEWHYRIKQQHILIHMELFKKNDRSNNSDNNSNNNAAELPNTKKQQQLFYANMNLKALNFNKKNTQWLPFRYPMLCAKVLFGIYWHALRLWLKKIPFHDHPNVPTK